MTLRNAMQSEGPGKNIEWLKVDALCRVLWVSLVGSLSCRTSDLAFNAPQQILFVAEQPLSGPCCSAVRTEDLGVFWQHWSELQLSSHEWKGGVWLRLMPSMGSL